MQESAKGCPAPQPITLQQRLQPLIGRIVSVYTPGFPRMTKTIGRIIAVTDDSFIVAKQQVFYDTSFYIVLSSRAPITKPYDVTATAEEIGGLSGKLIRVGKNFLEFVQVPGRNVPTLFPLNRFTEVTCKREHEE